jgi:hypothetical protein
MFDHLSLFCLICDQVSYLTEIDCEISIRRLLLLLIISDHGLAPLREILRCRFLEVFLQYAINDAFLVAIELLVHPQICLLLNFQYMFHDLTYLPGLLDLFFLNF